jgi:hypothetical protein
VDVESWAGSDRSSEGVQKVVAAMTLSSSAEEPPRLWCLINIVAKLAITEKNGQELTTCQTTLYRTHVPRLIKGLTEGPAWQYDIKFDGYRYLDDRNERCVVLWATAAMF